MENTVKWLVIHTEAAPEITENHRFDVVNEYHKTRDFPISSLGYHVGYHYFCERDGTERQARLDTDEGAHVKGMNFESLGYCLAGNGDMAPPTFAQAEKLKAWINRKRIEYNIPKENIVGHNHFTKEKTCPGKFIHQEYLHSLIENPAPLTETQKQSLLAVIASFIKDNAVIQKIKHLLS